MKLFLLKNTLSAISMTLVAFNALLLFVMGISSYAVMYLFILFNVTGIAIAYLALKRKENTPFAVIAIALNIGNLLFAILHAVILYLFWATLFSLGGEILDEIFKNW